GNCSARIHDSKGLGPPDHNDYFNIQSNHLWRKLLEPLCLASCITALNHEVAAFLVPVFTEALEQRVIKTFLSVGDKPHPPNFICLLRACHDWPRCRPDSCLDELAPSHCRPKGRPSESLT